ncbi:MAG: glycerate kinase [Treponema sp.]|nr:glycerate kinase [Treponema sp.]
MEKLYRDAQIIIDKAIEANMPFQTVREALKNKQFTGNLHLLAIGKASWAMAKAASKELGGRIKRGIVITKYGHSLGDIPGMEIIEAGHPLSDKNTIAGTEKAVDMAQNLGEDDELLFLISGGGSALFEKPLPGITLEDIVETNSQLLSCGADIVEINMIRKCLSAVKAGRFAQICAPAKIFTIVLSDVLGDRLDSIASGPAAPNMSTAEEALAVVKKYSLNFNYKVMEYIAKETPKTLENTETVVTGSVRALCAAAAVTAASLGYTPYILCSQMNCEAREAGRIISSIARQIDKNEYSFKSPCALIFGGETVVTIRGNGKGGRNQELALSAAEQIAGLNNLIIFSFGSDGTDGPTDAAGGIVDGSAFQRLKEKGINLQTALNNNDSYTALAAINSLIITGPTGTNVNDLTVVLHAIET